MNTAIEINDATFLPEVLAAERPTLVLVTGPDCPVCTTVGAELAELAAEFGGRIKTARLDVAQCRSLPRRLGVSLLPTVMIFDGGRERWRGRGMGALSELRCVLDRLAGRETGK